MRNDLAWQEGARCVDTPDVFFPDGYDPEANRMAKAYCAQCPVVDACLAYALDNDERHGTWGGKTARERRRIRRSQRLEVASC